MYSALVDKIGLKSQPAVRHLFPPLRTIFEVSGTRTIIRVEERMGENSSLYESASNLATILATHPRGKHHITVTVEGVNGVPFASGPKIMAFPIDRSRVEPEGTGAIVKVIGFDNVVVSYDSNQAPATILATM
jgi:hypothetical protein